MQNGAVIAHAVLPLFLDPDHFDSGSSPTIQCLLRSYFSESTVNLPFKPSCCPNPAITSFDTLISCAHVLIAMIRRYSHPSAPLNRLRVNVSSPVSLSDAKGDRHIYRATGAALHFGPTFDSATNHYMVALFNGDGSFTLLNDTSSQLKSAEELGKVVEPHVYAVLLVRQRIDSAADLHGPRVPAAAGCYKWVQDSHGEPQIVDMAEPSVPSESSSSDVAAVLDSPVKNRPNADIPDSQSSLQAMDVDDASIRRSATVKAALQAAAKAKAQQVHIAVTSRAIFQARFGAKNIRELGQGAFGQVGVRLDSESHSEVAMKTTKMTTDLRRYAVREAAAMVVLNQEGGHKSVVKHIFAGCVTNVSGSQEMCIAMPLFVGDLAQIAALRSDQGSPLTAVEGRGVVLSLCSALAFVHAKGIMHRDVKPDNLMVDASGAVLLGDFGAARRLAKEGENEITQIGTLNFQAPETLLHTAGLQPPYAMEVDIFSTGALWFWVRQSQIFPFSAAKQQEAALASRNTDRLDKATEIQALVAIAYSTDLISPPSGNCWDFTFFQDDEDQDLPDQEQDLILQCLAYNPGDRPTAQELVDDDLFDVTAPTGLPFANIRMPGAQAEGRRCHLLRRFLHRLRSLRSRVVPRQGPQSPSPSPAQAPRQARVRPAALRRRRLRRFLLPYPSPPHSSQLRHPSPRLFSSFLLCGKGFAD